MVQNQKGNDPLRWDKSGTVVESLGDQQYNIKMDGSGRLSLRNRQFLRRIEPFVPKYTVFQEGNLGKPESSSSTVERDSIGASSDELPQSVIDEGEIQQESQLLRRSTRVKRVPDRFEA